jgi:hypothetical protein
LVLVVTQSFRSKRALERCLPAVSRFISLRGMF